MAARLHRIGSIYSRIDGLVRKGHIKEIDIPLWFNVYKSFPPKYEPTYKRRAPDIKVREILYKEDILRAKIRKVCDGSLGMVDLESNRPMYSEELLVSCQKYISEGMSEDEALEKVKLSVESAKQGNSPEETSKGVTEVLEEVLA